MSEASTQHNFPFVLPIGYVGGDGVRHRRGALRKLRGTEEALFYDASLNGADLITQLLHRCLVRLEGFEHTDASLLEQLYSADRNYLLFELRRITFGSRLRTSYVCPACRQAIQAVEHLDDLTIRRLGDEERLDPVTVELEDGYEDRRGITHREVVLGFPKGVDEAFVASLAERDMSQARDVLLLRCVKRFGTLPQAELEAYGVKILQDLTLGDRHRLHGALNAAPGVDLVRTLACPACSAAFQVTVDVSDFFVLN
jgi:hypothetical protein